MLPQILSYCLEMAQFNGIFSSIIVFSSKVHKKSLHGLHPCLFIHSLCADCWRSKGEQDISSLVNKYSRFWLDWALCSLACGCQKGRRSWVHKLVFFLNLWLVIAYKIHTFCLVEEFDTMAQNHPIKENTNIRWYLWRARHRVK